MILRDKKFVLTIALCVIVSLAIIFSVFGHYIYNFIFLARLIGESNHLNQKEVIDEYVGNEQRFVAISKYIEDIAEDTFIEKQNDGKYKFVKVGQGRNYNVNVEDEKVNQDITYVLYKLNYKYINKNKNCIYFTKQSDFQYGQGVVFSQDGSKPSLNKERVLESIKDGWYYFEGD